jgi:hypothetical protein
MNEHHHQKLAVLHASLLHGKLPRNLHWTEVLDLIASIGHIVPTHGNEFVFIVGTEREFFRKPHGSELGVEEVSRLRRLLKAATALPTPIEVVPPGRVVVVLDHHTARIFHNLSGTRAEGLSTIEPYDPHHFHHHLLHRKEAHYRGDHVPEDASFYEEIAKALVPATQIVLIGHATGKSSALEALVEYLKLHRPDVYRNVVATETPDLSALTAPEVESLAKQHMMSAG